MSRLNLLSIAILIGIFGSANAFASRATNLVLGSGDGAIGVISGLNSAGGNGSLFYDDPYNIFYNPSYVNNYKSWVTVEKSNGPTGATAQGGFVMNVMNFNIGAYVNRVQMATGVSAAGTGSAASQFNYGGTAGGPAPVRPFEIFVGSDMGVKWGLSIGNEGTITNGANSSDWAFSLGAQISMIEPFVTVHIGPADSALVSHLSARFGTRVKLGEWIPYVVGYYATNTTTAGAGFTDKEFTIGGGISRSTKVAEGVRLMGALSFWDKNTNTNPVGVATAVNQVILPLEVGAEGDVTTWLTLRAGLGYRLFDRTALPGFSGYTNPDNSTVGRIGATIHVSKADFDWAVGNNGGPGAPEGGTATQSQSFDLTSGFFTAAALTYHW